MHEKEQYTLLQSNTHPQGWIHNNSVRRLRPRTLAGLILLTLLALLYTPTPTSAAPQLWLPTPPGERWTIIQGYACGTHDGWDRYSIDMARATGESRGAPVRAAADGTVFAWVEASGTLLVLHGERFYTMYTHMEGATVTERGAAVRRGTVIGQVGDRGAPGNPHLHFTAFTSAGYPMQSPKSIALSFADGPALPEAGGCDQHNGELLIAGGAPLHQVALPQVRASSPERRTTNDQRPRPVDLRRRSIF
jgi:murein DD-endopeptidase MepM/ murein hydrolase activator NlpD